LLEQSIQKTWLQDVSKTGSNEESLYIPASCNDSVIIELFAAFEDIAPQSMIHCHIASRLKRGGEIQLKLLLRVMANLSIQSGSLSARDHV
jgi:hypothetical protein